MNKEEKRQIAYHVDHTNLKKTATEDDIKKLCQEAIDNGAYSVCVAPYFVPLAKEQLENSDVKVCTVIGFPNGYSTTPIKEAETIDALLMGADEIDMVVNINMIKDQRWRRIAEEISSIADICHGTHYSKNPACLKVIIETCLLTDKEKLKMCDICIGAGANYIKTSTGFDKFGVDINDIKLMHDHIGDDKLLIKASGGIKTMETAKLLIEYGADRIGASSLFDSTERNIANTAFDEIR